MIHGRPNLETCNPHCRWGKALVFAKHADVNSTKKTFWSVERPMPSCEWIGNTSGWFTDHWPLIKKPHWRCFLLQRRLAGWRINKIGRGKVFWEPDAEAACFDDIFTKIPKPTRLTLVSPLIVQVDELKDLWLMRGRPMAAVRGLWDLDRSRWFNVETAWHWFFEVLRKVSNRYPPFTHTSFPKRSA